MSNKTQQNVRILTLRDRKYLSGFGQLAVIVLLLLCSDAATAACLASINPSTPTAEFVDNGDGTVTHTKSGLMWKQCSEGLSGVGCATGVVTTHTWQAALQLAQTTNAVGFATFTDWRVPNIKELMMLTEEQCVTPAINTTIFPATVSGLYWSSSPYIGSALTAWVTEFNVGNDLISPKTNLNYVRFVRGGP